MLYTYWKIGHQEQAPGKEHWGFKDGMLIDYQHASDALPGVMDRVAHAILIVDDKYEDLLEQSVKWVGADYTGKLFGKKEDVRRSARVNV